MTKSNPSAGPSMPDPSELADQWHRWALASYEDPAAVRVGTALAVACLGLGANEPERIASSVHAAQSLPRPDAELGGELTPDAVVRIFHHYLRHGWEPPNRANDGLALGAGERILAASPHERWVYTGKNVGYRQGGFVAFGNPALLAATALGSLALSGASKARAQRQAAPQWRFGGRGRLIMSDRQFYLWEDRLMTVPYASLQAATVHAPDMHLVLGTGTPIMLRVPTGAEFMFGLFEHHAAAQQQASPQSALPAIARSTTSAPMYSPDRRYWWNGSAWIDCEIAVPPGAVTSPDGTQLYDGEAWRRLPPQMV